MFKPPTTKKLLEQELYQTERELIGQEERVYRLKLALASAEAAISVHVHRRVQLMSQISTDDIPAYIIPS